MKKIVAIGPECTGKSILCEQLAQHYKTVWCPEYAREYLLTHGINYTYDDLLTIAKGQLALEDNYIQSIAGRTESVRRDSFGGVNKVLSEISNSQLSVHDSLPANPESRIPNPESQLLFIDTDMYVMKVWCEFVFGKCHRFILNSIVDRKYDLYLLCNTDIPWVKDELREYPDLKTRQQLYKIYKDILVNQSVPWVEIRGDYGERLGRAIEATDKLISA